MSDAGTREGGMFTPRGGAETLSTLDVQRRDCVSVESFSRKGASATAFLKAFFAPLRESSCLDTLKGRLLKFAVFFYTEFESVYTQRS